MNISNDQFDDFVRLAIDAIDPQFRGYLNEVPVVVEDAPDAVIQREMHLANDRALLGIFRGIPLDRQQPGGAGPHQIILYRRNILAHCRTPDELAHQVRSTLIHELGHYLGFSETELRRLARPDHPHP